MPTSPIQNRQNREMNHVQMVTFVSAGELDQLREFAQGASLEIFQLERGVMQGTLANVELGESSIHSNSFSLSARGLGALSEDRWTFVIISPHVEGVFNQENLQPQDVLVYRIGAEFEGTIHGAFKDWIFTVDDDVLKQEVRRLYAREMPELDSSCTAIRPRPEQVSDLRKLAISTLDLASKDAQLLRNSSFRINLQKQLIEQIAKIIACGNGLANRQTRSEIAHAQVVRASESYLETRINEPVSISDLCNFAGVSIRTLRNAFHTVIGLSPKAYLKRRRLQLVRVRLELSSSPQDTVTSIALQSGFFHLGHFSHDYHRYFNECPSTTLGRSRRQAARN